ncbi:MAG: T9SS type A sorting domain-containing protein [Bacteroidia bacterium]
MKRLFTCLSLIFFGTISAQDGILDTSFGEGGKVITPINNDERANGIVIQADGKIVVAGYTYSQIYGNDFACARYNTNGSLDTTFGNGGVATFDIQLGGDDKAMAIEILSDGKILLAGYSDDGSNKDAALIKLNTNGTLDTNFGNSGKVLTNYSTSGVPIRQDEYWVVKVHQLTGNIIVGGTSYTSSENSRGILARYTATGVLDTTFATGGKYTDVPNDMILSQYLFRIEDLAIKSNGKITIVGWADGYIYLGRLNANGTMDATFSSDGVYNTWAGSMQSMVLNNDDSFYFTGHYTTLYQTAAYTGYVGANGNGIMLNNFSFDSGMTASTRAIAKDSSGKLVIAGYLLNNATGNSSFLVGRLSTELTTDNTFGTDGFTTTAFSQPVSAAFDMKIQTDNKIILAGFSGSNIALARYNGNGVNATDEFKIQKESKLYPNPANSYIEISGIEGTSEYIIFDVNSRKIKSGKLTSNTSNVDVKHLEKGVYFIKIDGTNNLKFIKN